MALPLLMLIPWNPPAPPTPASNPWVPAPTVNPWDVQAVTDQADSLSVELISKAFGVRISLTGLIDLLRRFPHNNELSDSEMVQIVQMGSYFARHTVGWTMAPDNLDHWLVAGGLPDPAQIMDRSLIMNQERVLDTLCDKHYDAIVDGVKKRLSASAGTKFPTSAATIPGPLGKPIAVTPAESPLPAGGEETLYQQSSTRTTDDSGSDLFNAVNAVNLVSQVRVKSEVLDTGGWQVTIVDWQVWFWDSYDWNKEKQFVSIPIKLFDKLPALKPFQSTIEDELKRNSVDLSVLQEITVTDAQMSRIEGKTIVMPDGTTKQPKSYPIYSDGSWPFDASSTCGHPTVLTIPPP